MHCGRALQNPRPLRLLFPIGAAHGGLACRMCTIQPVCLPCHSTPAGWTCFTRLGWVAAGTCARGRSCCRRRAGVCWIPQVRMCVLGNPPLYYVVTCRCKRWRPRAGPHRWELGYLLCLLALRVQLAVGRCRGRSSCWNCWKEGDRVLGISTPRTRPRCHGHAPLRRRALQPHEPPRARHQRTLSRGSSSHPGAVPGCSWRAAGAAAVGSAGGTCSSKLQAASAASSRLCVQGALGCACSAPPFSLRQACACMPPATWHLQIYQDAPFCSPDSFCKPAHGYRVNVAPCLLLPIPCTHF